MRDSMMRRAACAVMGSISVLLIAPALAAGTGPASGSVFTLKSVSDGSCLGVKESSTASGAKVKVQRCSASPFQRWKAVVDGAGDYQLVNVGSGLCLDLPGASTARGTSIQQWGCGNGVAWQTWRFNADAQGRYAITSKASGLALDKDIYSTTGNVLQWTYAGTDNQQWIVGATTPPASAASSRPRWMAASNVRSTNAWRPSSASRTASPCSVVPLGLATRRATSSIWLAVAAAKAPVPIRVCSAAVRAVTGRRPNLSPLFPKASAKRAT